MISFLKRSKQLLNQSGELCVVLGNESCDLDSASCAIALAFFYSKIYPQKSGFVPVLNIPRSSFPIKTEVTFFLGKYNITDEILVFKDDIDSSFLKKNSVILVDHHVSPYKNSVIEVFDHRPFDSSCNLSENCKKTIEQVGSCATLIGNLILRSRNFTNEFELVMQLLYGAIVMDTVNFSPQACRATDLDLKIAVEIEDLLGISDRIAHRKGLFDELVKAREDTSSLTAFQLLHKDMKLICNSGESIKIAMPGFPISVQEFLELPNSEESVKTFAKEHNCCLVFLIGMKVINGTDVKRDIGLINISNDTLFKEILEKIKVHDKPNFQLEEINSLNFLGGCFFQQQNVKATRKHILPFVKNILDEKY